MERLKMRTADLVDTNIDKIAESFPNCITEARDEDGTVQRAVDFDLLRQELSATLVEGPPERYTLSWPGKNEAILTANAPIAKTLRPCKEESVDFENTKNIFIEGDNLDALKLLQETYLNRVKMIYIDPPYNTGSDFIYEDDFAENAEEFLQRSNQKDEEGNRLVANTESNGRFHSDWLSMMYARLKLARNLLIEDGVIFVSIDDNEAHNLRKVCDEVFGDGNFLTQFVWRTDGNFDNQAKIKNCHEYILVYAKNVVMFPHPPVVDPNTPKDSKLFRQEIRNTIVKNGPKNPVSSVVLPIGFPADFENGIITHRNNSWPKYESDAIIQGWILKKEVTISSGWSSKELLEEYIKNNCVPIFDNKGQETIFIISRTGAIEAIKKRSEEQSHVITTLNNLGGSQKATSELESLDIIFDDYPKPINLIEYFIRMNKGQNFIVLDFFSGSSTTAHAVMQLNAEDNGNRKFIMVQLPEPCEEKTKAFKAGFATIADIGKERIRRAGKKIREEWNAKHSQGVLGEEEPQAPDIGFRVFKIDTSNLKDVYYTPDELDQDNLDLFRDHIKPDRRPEDLLFQVFLDWGIDLSLPIAKETIDGKTFFIVDTDALVACFDKGITEEFVKKLAGYKPLRAVFRDDAFESDSVKINVEQIFKLLSPGTEVKSI